MSMPERKMTEKRATPQITALMTCHFRRSAAMRLCLERKEKNLLGHLCIVFTLIIKSLFTEKKSRCLGCISFLTIWKAKAGRNVSHEELTDIDSREGRREGREGKDLLHCLTFICHQSSSSFFRCFFLCCCLSDLIRAVYPFSVGLTRCFLPPTSPAVSLIELPSCLPFPPICHLQIDGMTLGN